MRFFLFREINSNTGGFYNPPTLESANNSDPLLNAFRMRNSNERGFMQNMNMQPQMGQQNYGSQQNGQPRQQILPNINGFNPNFNSNNENMNNLNQSANKNSFDRSGPIPNPTPNPSSYNFKQKETLAVPNNSV